jgi:hypothetical protein
VAISNNPGFWWMDFLHLPLDQEKNWVKHLIEKIQTPENFIHTKQQK